MANRVFRNRELLRPQEIDKGYCPKCGTEMSDVDQTDDADYAIYSECYNCQSTVKFTPTDFVVEVTIEKGDNDEIPTTSNEILGKDLKGKNPPTKKEERFECKDCGDILCSGGCEEDDDEPKDKCDVGCERCPERASCTHDFPVVEDEEEDDDDDEEEETCEECGWILEECTCEDDEE
jgi:hypothetical protein